MLDPASRSKFVWHIGWQDVVAIGALFKTGKLDSSRVVALGGPVVKDPRMVRTFVGAKARPNYSMARSKPTKSIARSAARFSADGRPKVTYTGLHLGRFHCQVSCIAEDRERVFFGWLRPGLNKYSTVRAYAAGLLGLNRKDREFTTNTNGSHRAMVPIGMFERVMPLDILPTFLLRALCADDVERAEALGCLELTEEDLALCTFVAPGKEDFGRAHYDET